MRTGKKKIIKMSLNGIKRLIKIQNVINFYIELIAKHYFVIIKQGDIKSNTRIVYDQCLDPNSLHVESGMRILPSSDYLALLRTSLIQFRSVWILLHWKWCLKISFCQSIGKGQCIGILLIPAMLFSGSSLNTTVSRIVCLMF